jgi:phage protein D
MSNIMQGKYRRGTSYNMEFPTLPSLNLQPGRVDLIQNPYEHDVLIMQFSKDSPLWFQLVKTGVPIKFSWNQDSLKGTWYGYVSSISRNVVGQTVNVMEVRCIGSTFPLKERTTKVFTNVSIPNAVKEIVTGFGFRFVGEDNDMVFEQLTIAGHSYWEWINEQAKRIGYAVVVNGMDFFFRPLDKVFQQSVTNVPVLSFFDREIGVNQQVLDRTLDGMHVMLGEHVESPQALRAIKRVGGVDHISSKVITSSKSPSEAGKRLRSQTSDVLFSEIRSDQVIDSVIAGTSMSEGAAQLARFNLPAKLKAQGDPRIKPFCPVFVTGTGEMTDGFWIAKEVKHSFAWIGDYQVEMNVGSDGVGPSHQGYLRQEPSSVIGMVNLKEALENGLASVTPTNVSPVKLVTKTLAQDSLNQGYNRTPARWTASNEVNR